MTCLTCIMWDKHPTWRSQSISCSRRQWRKSRGHQGKQSDLPRFQKVPYHETRVMGHYPLGAGSNNTTIWQGWLIFLKIVPSLGWQFHDPMINFKPTSFSFFRLAEHLKAVCVASVLFVTMNFLRLKNDDPAGSLKDLTFTRLTWQVTQIRTSHWNLLVTQHLYIHFTKVNQRIRVCSQFHLFFGLAPAISGISNNGQSNTCHVRSDPERGFFVKHKETNSSPPWK